MPPKQFWEHYCEYQQDIMGFPLGKECDWCGETEPTYNHKQHKREKSAYEKLYGYHPQELLVKKILPVDVFYKLFGQNNE
tara:strand:- start:662 stop:901 length:240 start_codon:yes stop_codon:yes gene_type:complete